MDPTHGPQGPRGKQTTDSFAQDRPRSLRGFHDVMKEALDRIEARIQEQETSFLVNFSNYDDYIRSCLPAINAVVTAFKIPNLSSMTQLEQLTELIQEPKFKVRVEQEDFDAVELYMTKVYTSVSTCFDSIISETRELYKYIDKYCLCFGNSVTVIDEPYLETVIRYDKMVKEFNENIVKNLNNIPDMTRSFQRDGLLSKYLDAPVMEKARRCNCLHAPFLLLFHQACENVSYPCAALRNWIKMDSTFPEFLKYDIRDQGKIEKEEIKKLKTEKEKKFHLNYKVKSLRKELEALTEEMARLKDKETLLRSEEEQLSEAHRQTMMDLELKEMRRETLAQTAHELSQRDYNEKFERLMSEMGALKDKLPSINRKLEDTKRKTRWLNEKSKRKKELEQQLCLLKPELKQVRRTIREIEYQLRRVGGCLLTLRNIYMFKTNPDALRRIFLNLPLSAGRGKFTAKRATSGRLNRVTKVVARRIDGDWKDLYRSLPFVPTRGDETVTSDLSEFMDTCMRQNSTQHAQKSLTRWQRMHTSASVDDLKNSLTKLKRDDIVQKINYELKRPMPPKPKPYGPRKILRFPRLPIMFYIKNRGKIKLINTP